MSKEIIINPSLDALYYSFFFIGLHENALTRLHKEIFDGKNFPFQTRRVMAFVIEDKKIVIDAMDEKTLHKEAYDWCDVYGKSNFPIITDDNKDNAKVVPIGPSFGVRAWPLPRASVLGISNFFKSGKPISKLRSHLAYYYGQYRYRLPETHYHYNPTDGSYVFSASTKWKKEVSTNNRRARFFQVCQSDPRIDFEGGFVPRKDFLDFSEYTIQEKYSIREYLKNTQRSLFVFNTPAVQGCLGWKLGEFLAMGKAIISTPINKMLPAQLEHKVHIHYVADSIDSLQSAIDELLNYPDYRHYLEQNARSYYMDFLQPSKVIGRLLSHAGIG